MKAVKIGRVVLRQQMTKEGALRVARPPDDRRPVRGGGYTPKVKSTRNFYKIKFVKEG